MMQNTIACIKTERVQETWRLKKMKMFGEA